jgi:3-oxoacyl-[acyl-carrier protein] reductase
MDLGLRDTVVLLASPLSGWTTGQVVSVNGGYAMV